MCTWSKLLDTRLFISSFVAEVISVSVLEMRMLSIMRARRGTLKWCRGSKRMMEAL
jgi:hypothetical protein